MLDHILCVLFWKDKVNFHEFSIDPQDASFQYSLNQAPTNIISCCL